MRSFVVLFCLVPLTSCGSSTASCSDSFLSDLPDLIRILPLSSSTTTAGGTVEAQVVVDDVTRFVGMQLRSVETDESFGTGSAASGMTDEETVLVSITVDEDAPPGNYYLGADVCAADDCPTSDPRTSYRLGSDPNFLRKTRVGVSEEEPSCVVVRRLSVNAN